MYIHTYIYIYILFICLFIDLFICTGVYNFLRPLVWQFLSRHKAKTSRPHYILAATKGDLYISAPGTRYASAAVGSQSRV